ncbi:MAG: glutathione peroxidase [Pirellulales bacterium]|nr:glutathione peroxidase [Pirellulales bacterium]
MTWFKIAGVACLCAVLFMGTAPAAEKPEQAAAAGWDLKMKALDGSDVNFADYSGKVLLIVNVASNCGYTGQYKALQALHEKYGKEGLVIIGVPANDFGAQEPGSDEEIAKFCADKYNVSFVMLSKVPTIVGENKIPLYKMLTDKTANAKTAGEVKWNFTKFLVGRNGKVLARFEPGIKPESNEVVKAIEAELDNK